MKDLIQNFLQANIADQIAMAVTGTIFFVSFIGVIFSAVNLAVGAIKTDRLKTVAFLSVADAFTWILYNGYVLTGEGIQSLSERGYVRIDNFHIVIDPNNEIINSKL